MRQAKWLLIAAVAIFLILPGCKSMNPTANTGSGANTTSVTEFIGTWDLLAGTDQVKVGTATMSWEYDYFNPDLSGNDKFVNLKLRIEFHADDPHTFSGDAQVNVSLEKPTEKGAPGQYNAFTAGFQVMPYPDDQTRTYLIPVSWLEAQPPAGVGWQCGGYVWFLWHTAGDFGTAMAGEFVKPRKGAWFNRLGMYLCNPSETPPPPPPGYDRTETAWGYDIYNADDWFWAVAGRRFKWGGVIPYTLGGTTPTTADLWAGAGQNNPANGVLVGTVSVWDGYEGSDPTRYVYVKYDIALSPWVILDVHFGADPTLQDMYDRTNFAPGLLGNSYEGLADLTSFTQKMEYDPAWGTSFVVAAHAVVAIPSSTVQMQVGAPQK